MNASRNSLNWEWRELTDISYSESLRTRHKLLLRRLVQEMRPSMNSRRTCQRMPAGKTSYPLFWCWLSNHRYAIFELEHLVSDGTGRIDSKILFILYAPDICDSKEKFVYATSKDDLKKKVQPFNKEMQVNDWADLDVESFLKILKFWLIKLHSSESCSASIYKTLNNFSMFGSCADSFTLVDNIFIRCILEDWFGKNN